MSGNGWSKAQSVDLGRDRNKNAGKVAVRWLVEVCTRTLGTMSLAHTLMATLFSSCQFMIVAFECEYQSGELQISDESTDVGYSPIDSLPANTLLCDVHAIRVPWRIRQNLLSNKGGRRWISSESSRLWRRITGA